MTAVDNVIAAMMATGKPYRRALSHQEFAAVRLALAEYADMHPEARDAARDAGLPTAGGRVVEWDWRAFGVVVRALNQYLHEHIDAVPAWPSVRPAGFLLVSIADHFGESTTP